MALLDERVWARVQEHGTDPAPLPPVGQWVWVLEGRAQWEAAEVVRHFPPFGFFALKQGSPPLIGHRVELYRETKDEGALWRRERAGCPRELECAAARGCVLAEASR